MAKYRVTCGFNSREYYYTDIEAESADDAQNKVSAELVKTHGEIPTDFAWHHDGCGDGLSDGEVNDAILVSEDSAT